MTFKDKYIKYKNKYLNLRQKDGMMDNLNIRQKIDTLDNMNETLYIVHGIRNCDALKNIIDNKQIASNSDNNFTKYQSYPFNWFYDFNSYNIAESYNYFHIYDNDSKLDVESYDFFVKIKVTPELLMVLRKINKTPFPITAVINENFNNNPSYERILFIAIPDQIPFGFIEEIIFTPSCYQKNRQYIDQLNIKSRIINKNDSAMTKYSVLKKYNSRYLMDNIYYVLDNELLHNYNIFSEMNTEKILDKLIKYFGNQVIDLIYDYIIEKSNIIKFVNLYKKLGINYNDAIVDLEDRDIQIMKKIFTKYFDTAFL